MDQEKYNLICKSYSVFLQDMMKELMMSSDFADVTLVCEDRKQIKAHRNILSACSPVFKDILQIYKSSSSIIYLRGVNSLQMESILQFIYIGEATILQEQITDFLSVAKSFDIKDLTQDCETVGHLREIEEETEMVEKNANGVEESFTNEHISEAETDTFSNVDVKIEHSTFYDANEPVYENADITCKEYKEIKKSQEPGKNDGMAGNRIKCDECHLTFSTRGIMNQHKRNIHEGLKYPCNYCDYQAPQSGTLTRHIKAKHSI